MEEPLSDEVRDALTITTLFLDMIARSLVAYESASIGLILDQVQREIEYDAAELGWPEETVHRLSVLHANLTAYVNHHLGR